MVQYGLIKRCMYCTITNCTSGVKSTRLGIYILFIYYVTCSLPVPNPALVPYSRSSTRCSSYQQSERYPMYRKLCLSGLSYKLTSATRQRSGYPFSSLHSVILVSTQFNYILQSRVSLQHKGLGKSPRGRRNTMICGIKFNLHQRSLPALATYSTEFTLTEQS